MISACVDIGTNTVLLLVAEPRGHDLFVHEDKAQVVRLGEGVDSSGMFHPAALARLERTLKAYDQICRGLGVTQRMSVATSATRDVKDPSAVVALCKGYGFPLRILSGDEEAEYTYKGAVGPEPGEKLVIDIGGGSTEIICGDGSQRSFEKSFNVGAVRMTERFLSAHPVPREELRELREFLRAELAQIPKAKANTEVVAVAGTPTTLAALDMKAPFDRHKVHGYNFSLPTLESWLERLSAMSVQERSTLPGMQPGREDVIVAGAAILVESLRLIGAEKLTVSDRGLRYGVLKYWKELSP
jgi:exopolyphosphatase/guanosine-5'-triphosphate,3'-diphosphate pyrophosphatase